MRLAAIAAAVVLALTAPAGADPARQDVTAMSSAEISTLQRRLTDAGCYTGAVDGKASAATKTAVSNCPDQRPRLEIETGMHVASIKRLAANKACTLAATASTDKTLRFWSLPDGQLLRTVRMAAGDGPYGKLNAVAMTPDGKLTVTGGFDARGESFGEYSAYVVDSFKGTIVARLGSFKDVIYNLTFSPDGKWLVVHISDQGIVVYNTSASNPKDWTEVTRDLNYAADTLFSAFAPDGRLMTLAHNSKMRVYSPAPDFRKLNEVAVTGGKRPSMVAIEPQGERLAVVYEDTGAVDILDAKDFHKIASADTGGAYDGYAAYSQDGRRLQVVQRNNPGVTRRLAIFDRDGKKQDVNIAFADTNVQSLQPCGAGLLFSNENPTFSLFDGKNNVKVLRKTVAPKMTDKLGEAFTLSADAKSVRFGLEYGTGTPVRFDLARASLTDSPNADPALSLPLITGLPVTKWEDEPKPLFGTKPVTLTDGEMSRSLAIRKDGNGFMLGAEFSFRASDSKGVQIWRRPAPSVTWGINLTPDGRVVVGAFGDGTMRWYRWSDGQELLALFVNTKTRAWVAWTPSGYYSASPGGEEMIGWRVNRSYEQPADFFPVDRFRAQFARPDIIDRVLDTLDEGEAIKQGNASRPVKVDAAPLLDNLPPVISILSPLEGAIPDGPKLIITYIVRSPSGTAVDAVEPRVNGRPLPNARALDTGDPVKKCLDETRGQGKSDGALQGCRGSITLDMPAGSAEVAIAARTGTRFGEAAILRIVRNAPPPSADVLKPKLYALIVGVADYVNPDYRLGLAAKDARDFRAALDNQKGGLYSEINVRMLLDREATVASIKDGLDWLGRQATSRDLVVLYFAGHGDIDQRTNRFYLLPSEADKNRLFSTALSREDVNAALELVPGKVIMFVDACHSGALGGGVATRGLGTTNFNDVVKDFANADNGLVLFAASTGRQVSMEDVAWGNGAFTKALVEGLGLQGVKGRANVLNGGAITLSELEAFVADRVKQLTNGAQSPVLINPKGVPNYPLALAR